MYSLSSKYNIELNDEKNAMTYEFERKSEYLES